MKKYLIGIGLMFCLAATAGAEGVERQAPEKGAASGGGKPERAKSDACDCCQKCKDAKGSIKPSVEEGVKKGDPCEECCAACGTPAPPAPQEMPPEVIEKRVQPEGKGTK